MEQLASLMQLDARTTAQEKELTSLRAEVVTLQQSKESADKDLDYFREQYGKASSEGAARGAEAKALEAANKTLREQVENGLKQLEATWSHQAQKLKTELEQRNAALAMLQERESRLEDVSRQRSRRTSSVVETRTPRSGRSSRGGHRPPYS